MKNNGLFSSLFIESLRAKIDLNDDAHSRMAALAEKWRTRYLDEKATHCEPFIMDALSYLKFTTQAESETKGVYPLYEDWEFSECVSVLYLIKPSSDIDDTSVGRFYPAKLLAQLRRRNLNWGILTDGFTWRLYSTKSSRPYEDYVELPLELALNANDEVEYGLFERFFHRDSFVFGGDEDFSDAQSFGVTKCRLDRDKQKSENILEKLVKSPLLYQIDEALQCLCNGFIHDMPKTEKDYTEEERTVIFENSVKLLYRCLFLFYAEAHHLLPSDAAKAKIYKSHSLQALCKEARKFRWSRRTDMYQYDLWMHLKSLVNTVNNGDAEYGVMGYNGGLFDDAEESFLGHRRLRNDFLYRTLYLLAYVEPYENDSEGEYLIPYEDLEVRHLGEIYENILEYTVQLADADRFRRRNKKGVEILLASQTKKQNGDTLIRKGDVFFGESALERKQTGTYYTPESLVRFLNDRTIIQPLRDRFQKHYRQRFDECLDAALNGSNSMERQGAAQSAALLVERFAKEEMLNFKVCDPAVGSGHFLVDAANQMSGLVVEILEEIPDVDNLCVSISSQPNFWRRLVTRHCLYGVDLNPLAINLAKLSLWLNCFAKEHKLTFIDHHLRQGNSLIGLRTFRQLKTIPKRKRDSRANTEQALLFDFDDLSQALQEAVKGVTSITEAEEDDTDTQKALLEESYDATSGQLRPLADLFIGYLMDGDVKADDYREIFHCLAAGKPIKSGTITNLADIWERLKVYQSQHQFFHWPLEFPDVFGTNSGDGFSGTVGNPPWDIVKTNSQEFFGHYEREFRKYTKQLADKAAEKLMKANPQIRRKWNLYCDTYKRLSKYYREPVAFKALGKGDINTFKLFLEQFFILIRNGGRMGIVVPSGVYTDQGCMPIRQLFFEESSIDFIYCFENRKGIFNIHRMFKFVLLGAEKGGKRETFKCAFMVQEPEILPVLDKTALLMSENNVRQFSPNSLSIMEFDSQIEIELAKTIYSGNRLLGEYLRNKWNTGFQAEFHITNDSHLFQTNNQVNSENLFQLWEGKQIWILTNDFSNPANWMEQRHAETKTTTRKVRVVYRAIAGSTNERTFIPTVIPAGFPTGNSLNVCPLPDQTAVVVAAVAGSFVMDWVIRGKVTTNVSIFILKQLPIVDFEGNDPRTQEIKRSIMARACQLICTSKEFSEIWSSCFQEDWTLSEFWYPSPSSEIYGPAEEWGFRERIAERAISLQKEWRIDFVATDGLPDGVDTGDRAQLRAEIDAYVAHLYGINREQFAYILDAFPVLRKKEEKSFGEFISRRKCLEEYDRLVPIIGENL